MYNPMTGDLIMLYLPWIIAILVAAIAIIVVLIWSKKRKDGEGKHSADTTSPTDDTQL